MIQTSNPVLTERTFAPANWPGYRADAAGLAPTRTGVMTLAGTIVKSAVLLVVCAIVAAVTWNLVATRVLNPSIPLLGGMLGGLVFGLIISFKPTTAPFLSPMYAALEGALLGALSFVVASRFGPQGGPMVFQAVLLTFGIMGALLMLFSFGAIRVGPVATKVVMVAITGVCLTYVLNWVLSMFGVTGLNVIYGSGPIGIGFSLLVIGLAAFSLVMNFQVIEAGVANGAPKFMEWYAGFGLLVTLVWLYIELLNLLSKLQKR